MYTQPQQFEPLMPSEAAMGPLLTKAHDLSRSATLLAGKHAPAELRSLLRNMNSYYTNRIGTALCGRVRRIRFVCTRCRATCAPSVI